MVILVLDFVWDFVFFGRFLWFLLFFGFGSPLGLCFFVVVSLFVFGFFGFFGFLGLCGFVRFFGLHIYDGPELETFTNFD